jgi:single-stranded DNA-binding protein
MNNLNSLILEGVVKGEPHKEEVGTSKRMYFTVEVARYYKTRDGNDATELSQFKVVAYGFMSTLPLKDGVGVRIVGRLKQNKWTDGGVTHSEVQVVAEHIEMRAKKGA